MNELINELKAIADSEEFKNYCINKALKNCEEIDHLSDDFKKGYITGLYDSKIGSRK